jgi:hypothetical protein
MIGKIKKKYQDGGGVGEYNLGGEMNEDKLNELYMALQLDALPKVDSSLMQPSPSEADNAHSAIDSKIFENDLYSLIKEDALPSRDPAWPDWYAPGSQAMGDPLPIDVIAFGTGAGLAGAVGLKGLQKLSKALKRSKWKNVPHKQKNPIPSGDVLRRLSSASDELYKIPTFMRTGDYARKMSGDLRRAKALEGDWGKTNALLRKLGVRVKEKPLPKVGTQLNLPFRSNDPISRFLMNQNELQRKEMIKNLTKLK